MEQIETLKEYFFKPEGQQLWQLIMRYYSDCQYS